MRDLIIIKKERIIFLLLESYISIGFKIKDLIEIDNRKIIESIYFDFNNVKIEFFLDLFIGLK